MCILLVLWARIQGTEIYITQYEYRTLKYIQCNKNFALLYLSEFLHRAGLNYSAFCILSGMSGMHDAGPQLVFGKFLAINLLWSVPRYPGRYLAWPTYWNCIAGLIQIFNRDYRLFCWHFFTNLIISTTHKSKCNVKKTFKVPKWAKVSQNQTPSPKFQPVPDCMRHDLSIQEWTLAQVVVAVIYF
jgi:hypothetical protein